MNRSEHRCADEARSVSARDSAVFVRFPLENSLRIFYVRTVKSIEKEYHREYYLKNRAKWRAYGKRYYQKRKKIIAEQRAAPEARKKLSEYLKAWRAANVEKRRSDMRKWQSKNAARVREYRRQYAPRRRALYAKRREEILLRKRQFAPRYRDRVNRYQRTRRVENVQFMLASRLRATLVRALHRQYVKKSKRTMELVGCSPEDLKGHIESQFVEGMTWNNRHLWHVDHVRPLASFDLRDVEEQRKAMHFSNLRPLWKEQNHRKSDKW